MSQVDDAGTELAADPSGGDEHVRTSAEHRVEHGIRSRRPQPRFHRAARHGDGRWRHPRSTWAACCW